MLRGTWGRGKTHLWRSLVNAQSPERYAYVSLFGINTLDDLKDSISIAEENLSLSSHDRASHGLAARLANIVRRNKKAGLGVVKQALDADVLGAVLKKVAKAAAFHRVKNMLICLDDIDRRGDGLSLKDVLGLVSSLWEQRGCRVVVILNTNGLSKPDMATWEANKEKVFQSEMEFEPTAEKCVGLVIDCNSTDEYDQNATRALLDLNITNIRIVERVRTVIEQVKACLEGASVDDYTKRRIVRTLTWGVYCLNARAEGAPPLEDSNKVHRLAGRQKTVRKRSKPSLKRA